MSVDARATLVTFYEEHDPAAVDRVDSLLASHSKSAIRTALLKKYDSAPEGWERLSDTRAQSYRKLLWPAAVAAATCGRCGCVIVLMALSHLVVKRGLFFCVGCPPLFVDPLFDCQ